jgi:hypothetical protein
MTKPSVLAGFVAVCTLLHTLGCSKKEPPADQPAASARVTASAASSTLAAAHSPSADSTDPSGPGVTIMGRLAKEATGRPGLKPTAEDVFAGFEKIGATVPQKEQTLAKTYNAAYCIGGYTADRILAVNVCEYGSEAAATAGRDLSLKLFPDLPTRNVWQRKSSTLTIIQQKRDAPAAALQKKLVDAFLAL